MENGFLNVILVKEKRQELKNILKNSLKGIRDCIGRTPSLDGGPFKGLNEGTGRGDIL